MIKRKRMLALCLLVGVVLYLPLQLFQERFIVVKSLDWQQLHFLEPEEHQTVKADPCATMPLLEWVVPHFHSLFRRLQQPPMPHNNQTRREKETVAGAATTTSSTSSFCSPPNEDSYRSLLSSSIPYYVYPPEVLYANTRYYLDFLVNNTFDVNPMLLPGYHRGDAAYEVDILNALLTHSSRVYDVDQAELFIIAAPFSAIYYDVGVAKKVKEKNFLLRKLYWNLKVQPGWLQGKPHVAVAMTSHLFTCLQHISAEQLGLDRLYLRFENVSVARADDFFAVRYAAEHQILPPRGFDDHFSVVHPVTKYTFSIGLGSHAKHVPLTLPTWEKFVASTNFIFYRTRKTGSNCNSTEYRFAPIHNVTWSDLPLSSVGFNLPKIRWLRQFVRSKFCLVIRGDTPHSHSLFAAVKAGCIPVIISDWYLFYAPPFPATLNMWDFSIFLSEEEFIKNPHQSLASLQDLPQDLIEAKLRALAWAQRVMLLDHPQSLFIPAFLREAKASFTRSRSEIVPANETLWCPETCV